MADPNRALFESVVGTVIVDVLPTDQSILGFSNQWYPTAIETAQRIDDLEDIMAVIDGRAEIVNEVAGAPADVRTYIAAEIRALLGNRLFNACDRAANQKR